MTRTTWDRLSTHRLLALLLFAGYFILAFVIVDDYGITFDEAVQRRHGLVAVEYVADKLGVDHPPLTEGNHGFAPYGVLYQLVALAVEWFAGGDYSPFAYYRIRHILNFLLYGVALASFYGLLRLRWPDRQWLPLIGTAVLFVSPRIFANAFFNPKDHVAMVFYVVATYSLFRFLHRRDWTSLALHVVCTAIALNTRPSALIIPAGTICLLLAEQVVLKPPNYRRLLHAVVYLPACALLALLFFPSLWEDPGGRATTTVSKMANYAWGGEVLFFGQLVPADALPWYYLPVWIGITTPLIYLPFIVLGVVLIAWRTLPLLISTRLYSDRNRQYDLIQLMYAIMPVVLVIMLNSTLYHGWRHLYFIYPSLVYTLVAAYALLPSRYRLVASLVLALGVGATAIKMIEMHPHQQVYFNTLVRGKYTLQRFDMDYNGSSFRAALVQLAEDIPDGETRGVYCQIWPCVDNVNALPADARRKIRLEVKWHLADYVATNFAYPDERNAIPYRGEYFQQPAVELYPDGKLAIGIYRVNSTE